MILLQTLEHLLNQGYCIEFKPELRNVYIKVTKLYKGREIVMDSALPLSDHFYENKIVDCLNYMRDEIIKDETKYLK